MREFDGLDFQFSQYLLLQSNENNVNKNILRKYLYIQLCKIVCDFVPMLF